MEFYAECYLLIFIDDKDCPNFFIEFVSSFCYTGGTDACREKYIDVCEICAIFARDCGVGS